MLQATSFTEHLCCAKPELGPRDTEMRKTQPVLTSRRLVGGHTSKQTQLFYKTKSYNEGIIFRSAVKAQKWKRFSLPVV